MRKWSPASLDASTKRWRAINTKLWSTSLSRPVVWAMASLMKRFPRFAKKLKVAGALKTLSNTLGRKLTSKRLLVILQNNIRMWRWRSWLKRGWLRKLQSRPKRLLISHLKPLRRSHKHRISNCKLFLKSWTKKGPTRIAKSRQKQNLNTRIPGKPRILIPR